MVVRESPDPVDDLKRRLPDTARWVEARSILLAPTCTLAAFSSDPLYAVVHSDTSPVTAVIGRPPSDPEPIVKIPEHHEVLVQVEDHSFWRQILYDRSCERAILHQLKGAGPRTPRDYPIRLVEPHQLASDSRLPQRLRLELASALSPISVTWLDRRPVSFCYAASQTETLWDISIETLPEYRRRGAAAACCAHLIEWMRSHRRRDPVWGSLESNQASRALAASLGFHPVDQIWVFEERSGG